MKSGFSENIKSLRKQRHLTQEQFAEAMGVTVGAIYKWEQGLSSPDISVIMEIAGFFGVSVDALIGYEMQNSTVEAYAQRIYDLQQKKAYEQAAAEAEKALVLYPNQFGVVYRSGTMYALKGIECDGTNIQSDLERAIELLQKSELLLSQNQDPNINIFTIRSSIANCLLAQGKKESALKMLKENNVGGMHNSLIGVIYASSLEYPPEKAETYLTDAFQDSWSNLLRTMIGYFSYYERKNNREAQLEVALWSISNLESFLVENRISVVHKYLAGGYSECARLHDLLGHSAESQRFLKKAYETAAAFDRSPSMSRRDIRFFLATEKGDTIYDDASSTAMSVILQQMDRENWSAAMRSAWERISEK